VKKNLVAAGPAACNLSAVMSECSQPDAAARGECMCLARSVVQALEAEPTLEAVTIDRDRQTISLATLGQADVPRIAERLTGSYESACADEHLHECSLLVGKGIVAYAISRWPRTSAAV